MNPREVQWYVYTRMKSAGIKDDTIEAMFGLDYDQMRRVETLTPEDRELWIVHGLTDPMQRMIHRLAPWHTNVIVCIVVIEVLHLIYPLMCVS